MKTMLQVRIDEDLKREATMVYEQLGIDLSTAIRMFLKKSVMVNGIPFEMKNNSSVDKTMAAINSMRNKSKQENIEDMSLDEINQIIKLARMKNK